MSIFEVAIQTFLNKARNGKIIQNRSLLTWS
jgi:hypothetical protein